MTASIFFNVSQNQTNYRDKTNKAKQITIFLPKINRVFLSQIVQNLNGMSVLDKKRQEKKSIFSGRWLKPQNADQN